MSKKNRTQTKSYSSSQLFSQVKMSTTTRSANGTLLTAPEDNSNSYTSGSDLCPDPAFIQWCLQLTYLEFNGTTVARELIPDRKTVCTTTKDFFGTSQTTCDQENVPFDSTLKDMADCLNKNKMDAAVNGTIGSMPPITSGSTNEPCEFQKRATGRNIVVRVKVSPMPRERCSALLNRMTTDIDQCTSTANEADLRFLGFLALIVPLAVGLVCGYRKTRGKTFGEQTNECCAVVAACAPHRTGPY